jgi:hypothetical protein
MATLITLSIKQENGSYKNYTISIYDQVDPYGNNVAMYEEQSKEERESKAKKKYLGNGKVVWTNGQVEVAPKKDKANTSQQENIPTPQRTPQNFHVVDSNIDFNSEVDDLPF